MNRFLFLFIEMALMLLFTYVGTRLTDLDLQIESHQETKALLQDIRQSVNNYQLETLSVGVEVSPHYDEQAQVQLYLDNLLDEYQKLQPESSKELVSEVNTLHEGVIEYLSIVTMMGTSKRLIASAEKKLLQLANQEKLDAETLQTFTQLRALLVKVYTYQVNTDETLYQSIQDDLRVYAPQFSELKQIDIQWSVIEKHLRFIMKNVVRANILLEKLRNQSVIESVNRLFTEEDETLYQIKTEFLVLVITAMSLFFMIVMLIMLQLGLALKQSNRRVVEASQAKEKFLANMSHEIRTPMNGVLGITELCLKKEKDPTIIQYLTNLKFSAKSLVTILNDILDFSKIESGKLEIEAISFDITSVLDNVKNLFQQHMNSKAKVQLFFEMDVNIPKFIQGDPVRLGQVIINLVSNALKFTEKGTVTVSIDAEVNDSGQMFYRIKVVDTGIGMTKEQQNRIFQSFVQADQSTTRKYGGTGLGLAICEQLVRLMDGQISVSSEVDKGTSFSVQFPLVIPQLHSHKEQNLHTLRKQNVLIVDDHIIARDTIRSMCEYLDMHVTTAHNAQSAVEKLTSSSITFHYIILDWEFPMETGLDIAKKLNDELAHKAKFILMTAYSKEELYSGPEMDVFHHYLQKPFSLKELTAALLNIDQDDMELMDEQKGAPALPTYPNKHVLLVEDVEVNRLVAEHMLRDFGLKLTLAKNGEEAIEHVRQRHFDLIFMDIQMPVMDGLEATKAIRESDTSTPIIALTANVLKQEIEKYIKIGMNGHIGKPFEQDTLGEILETFLSENTAKEVLAD
ncbi:hybrid sensor histidine kinase/response regulator [Algicola sagamiensis]|uniref:hybrid sensor histidine kinase/response regulator n=1 Tax=Algicola sagamiensis TaxID=163869 RepID=UPI00035F67FE|nr:response regulator [Algicola sagamiensis]